MRERKDIILLQNLKTDIDQRTYQGKLQRLFPIRGQKVAKAAEGFGVLPQRVVRIDIRPIYIGMVD